MKHIIVIICVSINYLLFLNSDTFLQKSYPTLWQNYQYNIYLDTKIDNIISREKIRVKYHNKSKHGTTYAYVLR